MNPQTSSSSTTSILPHCQHRTASGRRCRMAVSDLDSGLCSKHAADRQKELDRADLASALIGDIQEFRDAVTINHSLGELYKLQARNKITPRRAAVMAYTCNLLLRTLPAIALASSLQPKEQGLLLGDFSDWPDPEDGSGIKGPAVFRRAVLARAAQEKTLS
jgi:hypothetical protein